MIEDGITSLETSNNQEPLTKDEQKAKTKERAKAWKIANKAYLMEYRAAWRVKNREAIRAYDAELYQKPEFREKKVAYQAGYAKKPGAIEHRRTAKKKRYATPDGAATIKADNAKRRAVKRGATIGDTKPIREWMKAWKARKHVICLWCNMKIKASEAHVDHIVPLNKGGAHTVENLCISCVKCNCSKQDKMPEFWNAMIAEPVLLL